MDKVGGRWGIGQVFNSEQRRTAAEGERPGRAAMAVSTRGPAESCSGARDGDHDRDRCGHGAAAVTVTTKAAAAVATAAVAAIAHITGIAAGAAGAGFSRDAAPMRNFARPPTFYGAAPPDSLSVRQAMASSTVEIVHDFRSVPPPRHPAGQRTRRRRRPTPRCALR
ncbi:MAG: hypothetical protein MUC68_17880 [Burkholderiaceae bacterium]|nr:hypothetical protein [Burkholderiaceae bacterium]